MSTSPQIRLTPAQRRFIEKFDLYTAFGADPKEYQSLRDLWHIQHRTMNWCHRVGILKCVPTGSESTFIVNPALRKLLNLPDRKINMDRLLDKTPRIIKCNVVSRRKRSTSAA
jgi:hypothetical protein